MKAPLPFEMEGVRYEDVGAAYYALCVPEKYRGQLAGLGSKRARKLYKDLPHLESNDTLTEERLYLAVKAKYDITA